MPRTAVPVLRPRTAKRSCPLPPEARLPRPRIWRPVLRTVIVLFSIAIVGLTVKLALDAL